LSTIETGVFGLICLVATALTLFAFRVRWPLSPFLRLLSLGLFLSTAVLLVSGYGVQTTRTFTGAACAPTCTEITPLIPADGTGTWLGYIFVGFSILNLVMIVRETWEGGK